MAFTIRDFHDLIKLLEERPEWREELRRLILTDELLELPEIVRQLAEAQRGTEEELKKLTARVDGLAARVDELTDRLSELTARVDELTVRLNELAARVDELTDGLNKLAARVDELTARVNELAEAQRRTEEELRKLAARVDELAESQRKTEEELRRLAIRVDSLSADVETLKRDVAELKGDSLERRYRERAPSYFGRLLKGIRVLSFEDLAALADRGVEEGIISMEEREELLQADVVLRGIRWEDGMETYLVVEVSWGVGVGDVERAYRRAAVMRRLGVGEAAAAVAGRSIAPEAEELTHERGVIAVIDGGIINPPSREV